MPKLSRINWKKFEKFLLFVGCEFIRENGDHRIYQKKGIARPIVLPRRKELELFIIHNNIRLLGINIKEYEIILKNM